MYIYIYIYTHICIILSDVSCKREIWYLFLKKDHRSRTLKNEILRRILGPRVEEAKGERNVLHREENENL
jgi:hypothetical protein